MATFKVTSQSKDKFHLSSEFYGFPVTFVNGVRRILLSDLPTVVIRDVQVLENSTQMPHEMLKHRMELLPVNVHPTDSRVIREANIELRILPDPEKDRVITTDEFVIQNGREHILMRDRDLNTPLLFVRVRKGESIHMKGRLAIERGSQVCTASTKYHIDEELAKDNRKKWIEAGKDVREFDNFYIQKSYSVDERGRPNWIDMNIESVGVLPSKELLRLAVIHLKSTIKTWIEEAVNNIIREKEENVYHISLDGGHTIGALLQEVIYTNNLAEFVSYDIPHPLRPQLVLRFLTSKKPEEVLKKTFEIVNEYCDIVEKSV